MLRTDGATYTAQKLVITNSLSTGFAIIGLRGLVFYRLRENRRPLFVYYILSSYPCKLQKNQIRFLTNMLYSI